MTTQSFEIATPRLLLRSWRPSDSSELARMNADAEVAADLGGPISSEASNQKMRRYIEAFQQDKIARWVVNDSDDRFIGYCGIMPVGDEHPLGAHLEIGWRLVRQAWGNGFATEAAQAALDDGFDRLGLSEVLAYTASDNIRSQNVMTRLGLQRKPGLDFAKHYDEIGLWKGLVWACSAATRMNRADT